MSHGFVGFSASAPTTHEHFHSLQCLSPRKCSPYQAIRHMPDTPCARPYALVHGHASCALWDLTHRSRFVRVVFLSNESGIGVSTQTRGYDNFFALLRFFVPRSTDYLCTPEPSVLRVISNWNYLTNGAYDLHDRKNILCSSMFV